MKPNKTASTRIADEIVSTLIDNGVDHIFMLAGGNVMFINDAIVESGLSFTAFHHEQAAAMAAEAYARTSGKLTACIVTSGPGVSNLVTGVAGAYLDSAAVIYVGGQAKSNELATPQMFPGVRQYGTFETPGINLLNPICKKTHLLKKEESPRKVVSELCECALAGRPGPVYLEVPLDVQSALLGNLDTLIPNSKPRLTPSKELDEFVSAFLIEAESSKAPLILAGYGVVASGRQNEFREFVESFGFQAVTTQLAKQLLAYESPHFVGHVGIRGDRAGNLAVFESDCILVLGSSLQQQTIGYEASLFAPNAKIYLVDFEKSVTNKNLPINFTKIVDESVADVLKCFSSKASRQILGDSLNWKTRNLENKMKLSVMNEPHILDGPRINLYEFVNGLSNFASEGDTVITDAGLCFYVMGQAFKVKDSQHYVVSGGLGAMGYALPAAIGASTSAGNRVVAVTGDGSLQMNVQELSTLALSGRDVFIFVINNDGYASIRNSQRSFFGSNLIGSSESSGVAMPIWSKIAEAYGLKYRLIRDRESIKIVLDELSTQKGPVLIEVMCHVDQQIMPMIASVRNEDGKLISNPLHVMSPISVGDSNLPQIN